MDLLRNYPWDEQRRSSFVGLNGASVTIEGHSGRFLKAGLYYHGKFILYLLNERKKLFLKIVDTWNELELAVRDFYENVPDHDFVKYLEWVRKPSRYFVTKDFGYKVSGKRILRFLALPLGFTILTSPALLLGFNRSKVDIGMIAALTLVFILLVGIKLLLFFNYYWYSRKLYLKISRGIDTFAFGTLGKMEQYSKQDIEWVKEYSCQGQRVPWNDCYVYVIRMKNGKELKLTNLLISSFIFGEKFPGHEVRTVNKPFATVYNCP